MVATLQKSFSCWRYRIVWNIFTNKLKCSAYDPNKKRNLEKWMSTERAGVVSGMILHFFWNGLGAIVKIVRKTRSVSRPVARFWSLEGQSISLGGHDFCFYHIFKTNVLGIRKFGGEQKNFGRYFPRMPPRGYGPVCIPSHILIFVSTLYINVACI